MKFDNYFAPALHRSQERATKRRLRYLSDLAAAIPVADIQAYDADQRQKAVTDHQQHMADVTASAQSAWRAHVAQAREAIR